MFGKFSLYKRKWLAAAIFFVLEVILQYIFRDVVEAIMAPDSSGYVILSQSIVSGNGMGGDIFRTPGYPLFLSVFYTIGKETLVIVVQCVLMSLGVYIMLLLGEMYRVSEKWLVAVIVAIMLDINILLYGGKVLTETLFWTSLLTALFFWARYMHSGRTSLRDVLGFAVMLNWALMVRPIMLYFNILLIFGLLLCAVLKRFNWKHLLTYTAVTACVICGWFARNYAISGEIVFATVEDYNKLMWNSAYVYNYIHGNKLDDVQIAYESMASLIWDYVDEETFYNDMNGAQQMKIYGRAGRDYLSAHRKEYIIVNINGLFTTYFGACKIFWSTLWGTNTMAINICIWMYRFLLLAEYVSLVYSLIKNRKKLGFIDTSILVVILYLTIASMPCGSSRFRVPITILICTEIIIANRRTDEENEAKFPDRLLGHRIV